MALLNLCPGDPVVTQLRDVFKANVLRIPEERVVPLTVLASTKGSVRFLGEIASLLAEPVPTTLPADLKESDMADLTNRRSRALSGDVGAQVLSGLLAGMGNSAAPEISAHMKNEKTIRFNFPKVRRRYVEVARIGQLLAGKSFDRKNLLFKTLLDPKTKVLLIDSVITSTGFEIESGSDGDVGLKANIAELQSALAGAKIEVSATDSKHLAFSSERRLTFAFTCLSVGILANGAIRTIAPFNDKVGSPMLADKGSQNRGLDAHVLLTRAPEFIDFTPVP